MKVRIFKIGKPSSPLWQQLVDDYRQRLRHPLEPESVIIPARAGVEKSGGQLLSRLAPGGRRDPGRVVVALDERGRPFTSPGFAGQLAGWRDDPAVAGVDFIVGGPYGLPDDLGGGGIHRLSLSGAVFPSDLAWLILWEQLYRAQEILRGSPYHHQ